MTTTTEDVYRSTDLYDATARRYRVGTVTNSERTVGQSALSRYRLRNGVELWLGMSDDYDGRIYVKRFAGVADAYGSLVAHIDPRCCPIGAAADLVAAIIHQLSEED